MASRARKRIHAPLRRGPDGSAFRKCEHCGVLVAVALFDMHECGDAKEAKRSRLLQDDQGLDIEGQPRSPFCCFMESFRKKYEAGNLLEVNQRAFDAWKNMTERERYPYVTQAEIVNSAHLRILLEESNNRSEVDDEADSAMVGKFNLCCGSTLHQRGFSYRDNINRSQSGYYDTWDYLDAWTDN